MKLISDILNRRIDQSKDLSLNNQDYKSIWHFYQVYRICLNVSGDKDKLFNFKIRLLVKLLSDPKDVSVLNKLKSFVSEDSYIVERVLNNFKESENTSEILEDFYPVNIFGVNLDDRNL